MGLPSFCSSSLSIYLCLESLVADPVGVPVAHPDLVQVLLCLPDDLPAEATLAPGIENLLILGLRFVN